MQVSSWDLFPDELRAALIQLYPSINWRVTLNRRSAREVEGVNVQARRAGREADIWIPTSVINVATLHDLLEEIYREAEVRLTQQTT
jgi:hypothetical protein